MFKGKKIILGISGSIATYKSAYLVRQFVRQKATVKVIMTKAACEFVSPLTFSTLSKNQVLTEIIDEKENSWNNHVELGRWGDLMVIAPASANTIAKMANGICDNLLLATYLSATCPVFIAPAMDEDMYHHPATQNNLQILINYNNYIIGVEHGELASGLIGEGRMAEPDDIIAFIAKHLSSAPSTRGQIQNSVSSEQITRRKKKLKGKNILVSAGPTYEPIDPVRFIGNHSSGKMGIALANALFNEGANVTLIKGPIHPNEIFIESAIRQIEVTTAAEMYEACINNFSGVDITIMAAAVADYSPVTKSEEKIKKSANTMTLSLKKTKDILKELGQLKTDKQLLIGFALETNNEMDNAIKKLKDKNLDFIILNSLNDAGAGFQTPTNKITIIDKNNNIEKFELKSKEEVAEDIINVLIR